MISWSKEKEQSKDKTIFFASNISESMFIHIGFDFEKYDIRPTHASFTELKRAIESSNGVNFVNSVSNQAILNRVKEMYQLDIPFPENKEWIRMTPGDELYIVSTVESPNFKIYEATELPPGVRLKLIKYRLVPRKD